MKILSTQQIREADQYTIKNEPISSIDLMERAASKCTDWLLNNQNHDSYVLCCGIGNNGGDGLVIARQLFEKGKNIEVIIVEFSENYSDDFQVNLNKLEDKGIPYKKIKTANELKWSNQDVLIDALFGSGLSRELEGDLASVTSVMNTFQGVKVAIDIPSGLFADKSLEDGACFNADYTLSFQVYKWAFLQPENESRVGRVQILDIGLSQSFIDTCVSDKSLVTKEGISNKLNRRSKYSHKGTFGHVRIVAGSYGKIGAALLSAKAACRSGAGLVSAEVPKCAYEIFQTAIPEVMVETNIGENKLQGKSKVNEKQVYAIGPGIGMDLKTELFLEDILENSKKPLVLDADALNILSENKSWLSLIPKQSILTPHPKELERLIGKWKNDEEKINILKEFAVKYNLVVILKGAHSLIMNSDGSQFYNSTGNPGMATGGSGDVLTGMVAAFLAQGYSSIDSAIIASYIHGAAGDKASEKHGELSLVASDIVDNIGQASKQILA